MSQAQLTIIMSETLKYYPSNINLTAQINNPQYSSDESSWIDRYTVDVDASGYSPDTHDMDYWIARYPDEELYIGGSDEMFGEGSYINNLLDMDPREELSGDQTYGLLELFDHLLLDTVEEDAVIRNRYLTAVANVEGLPTRVFDQDYPVYYVPPESNVELHGSDLNDVWRITRSTVNDVYSKGLNTVKQLKAAVDHTLITIPNDVELCLRFFDNEAIVDDEYEGESSDAIVSYLNDQGYTTYADGYEQPGTVDVAYDDEPDVMTISLNELDMDEFIESMGVVIVNVDNDTMVRGYLDVYDLMYRVIIYG